LAGLCYGTYGVPQIPNWIKGEPLDCRRGEVRKGRCGDVKYDVKKFGLL